MGLVGASFDEGRIQRAVPIEAQNSIFSQSSVASSTFTLVRVSTRISDFVVVPAPQNKRRP